MAKLFVVERCAEFAAECRAKPVPPEALHHAKRAVVDWYAALFAGAGDAPASLLEKALAGDLDRGNACLALGRKATARTAALINGTAAHTAEVDDIYREAIYHPGAPTIAAALAAGQDAGISGEALLRAVIVGYEISTRIGAAMGRAHYRYWHNTGTIGSFGAAAAGAAALGLAPKPSAHALATVATFAAALQQAFRMDSMSKPLHAGHAAEAGLLAALGAREGITGSLDVIEGEAGFGHAMGDGPDWDQAFATLGRDFNITQMTFKNHTCCGHTFAAIDGALEVQRQLGVKGGEIKRVRVATYRPALEVAGYDDPQTPAEARFSLKYVVANALTHGSVRLAAFTPERIRDANTRALMQRVELAVDPALDATFPGQRAARVAITTTDGREREFLQPTRKGDPDAPLSDADLDAKYMELSSPAIGAVRAGALVKRLWQLESAPGITDLHG